MRKRIWGFIVGLVFVFLTMCSPSAQAGVQSQAAPPNCVSVDVVLPSGNTITVCVPKQALPHVAVPGPIKTVKVPGPKRTITVEVPGPVRTKYVNVEVPGPTETVFRTIRAEPPTRQTVTATATVSTTASPYAVTRTIPQDDPDTVTVTEVEAVGYSLLAIIVGALLTLLFLYVAYRLGWLKGAEHGENMLEELKDSLTYDRQH